MILHSIGMLSLAVVMFGAKASLAAEPPQSGTGPVVHMTHETQVLTVDRNDPQLFRAVIVFGFTWDPKQLPGFEIGSLDFLNRAAAIEQRVTPMAPRKADGWVGVLITARGQFEASNNFAAHPFNIVRLPIIFEIPKDNGNSVQIADAESPFRHGPEPYAESDGYRIKTSKLKQGSYYEVWETDDIEDQKADVKAVGLIIDAEHVPARTFLMVFVPLLLIWGVIYSSLWWKEESACSRAVMASLFAATALAFSSINLQPNVSYITTGTLAFTLLYINLAVIGTFSVLAFRANKRGAADDFRRLRAIGRSVAGVLLAVSVTVIVLWVVSRRDKNLIEWFDKSQPLSKISLEPKV